ncbi:hypothetical protein FI667_g7184, partial [Globisporangium splendens]
MEPSMQAERKEAREEPPGTSDTGQPGDAATTPTNASAADGTPGGYQTRGNGASQPGEQGDDKEAKEESVTADGAQAPQLQAWGDSVNNADAPAQPEEEPPFSFRSSIFRADEMEVVLEYCKKRFELSTWLREPTELE